MYLETLHLPYQYPIANTATTQTDQAAAVPNTTNPVFRV